jgi:hypothetical protein
MIASLHIGGWSGMKFDQDETDDIRARHGIEENKDAGAFNKRIISLKALHLVNTAASAARRAHRLLTSPWDDNGGRILTNTGYFGYCEEMRLKTHNHKAASEKFVEQYAEHVNEARERLKGMFNPGDYPSAEDVRRRFYIDTEIEPIPDSKDFRVDLSDASVKAIVKDMDRRVDERLKAATNDVFLRVADVTEKMCKKLRAYVPANGAPEQHKFHDSIVWNIKELADLLPSLNLTGDKRFDQLRDKLLDDLCEHPPIILKSDERLRNQTADKAAKILAKVQGYLA